MRMDGPFFSAGVVGTWVAWFSLALEEPLRHRKLPSSTVIRRVRKRKECCGNNSTIGLIMFGRYLDAYGIKVPSCSGVLEVHLF